MSDLMVAIVGQGAGYLIMGFLMLQLIPRSDSEWAKLLRFGRPPKGRHAIYK